MGGYIGGTLWRMRESAVVSGQAPAIDTASKVKAGGPGSGPRPGRKKGEGGLHSYSTGHLRRMWQQAETDKNFKKADSIKRILNKRREMGTSV